MRNRFSLISGLSSFLLFAALEACSIVLIANNSVVQRYRALSGIRDIQSFFWNKGESISYYASFRQENENLLAENLSLKNEIESLKKSLSELDSNYVSVLHDADFDYVRARIVKNSINSQHNVIIIDRGSDDGVSVGMGIISDKGVIGIVDAVGKRYSRVISFLSTGQTVSAKLSSSGVFGPMVWDGASIKRVVLSEIPIHQDVSVGDTVVTSGYSTIYPSDIPLGVVTSTKDVRGVSQNLTVELFEDFSSVRFVYVAISNRQEEILSLDNDEQ